MSIGAIIALVTALFEFAKLLVGAYFDEKKAQEAADKQFVLDETARRKIFDAAAVAFQKGLAQDNADTQTFEDSMDAKPKDKSKN